MAPLRDLPTDAAMSQNEASVVQNQAVDTPAILAHPHSSPKSSPEVDSEVKAQGLQILPLGPMEHVVPLPMVSSVRSIYETAIENQMKFVKVLNSEDIDADVMGKFDSMIDELKRLCNHQSLIEAHFATQETYPDFDTTRFAENISTKCQFMAGLLRELRSHDTHIAIIVRPGRMKHILGAMLREYGIGSQPTTCPLRVTLLPIDFDEYAAPDAVSLVIDFDSSFKHSDHSKLRTSNSENGLTPLIHLVVNHSIEHLELCLDDSYKSLERTRALANGTIHMLEEMGKLEPERYLEGELAGKAVAAYIKSNNPDRLWPLLPMPGIEGLDLTSEISSQSEVHATQSSGSTTQSHNVSSPAAAAGPAPSIQSGFKRPLQSDEDTSDFAKRQRLTPAPGEQSSNNNENSRVSDTVLARSNGDPSSSSPQAGGDEQMANTGAIEEQEDSISSILEKVR
jgi:hypothetical protein